jgi:hypothetical protein
LPDTALPASWVYGQRQLAQFSQILMGKIMPVIILGAILVAFVGLPLSWLRVKAERGLTRAIRSAQSKRQMGKSNATANESATIGYRFISNEAF